MGDFTLRPGRFSLGDFRLRLDPEIEAHIRALRSEAPSPRLRHLFLNPNWAALQQTELDRVLATPPPARPSRPLVPRGAGPSTPRAAEVGDLMRALWAVPAVQQASGQLLDRLSGRMQRDWQRASGAEQALVVSWSAVIGSAAMAGVLSNREAREQAFDLVVDRDIPVPGLDGLTIRLQERGGQATYRDIGGSGLTARAGGRMGPGGRFEVEAMLTLDVTRYLRNW
ncbi:MAG TPA: hypothetical protein VE173_04565 [Longimicrobiales bacterium]|nr:hypothetical protein [Longimicrobiales bacterium]